MLEVQPFTEQADGALCSLSPAHCTFLVREAEVLISLGRKRRKQLSREPPPSS